MPDSKTIWLFREQLVKADLTQQMFLLFHDVLTHKGFEARKGHMVDASIVDVPKQRNSREENAQIKQGVTPERYKKLGRKRPSFRRTEVVGISWTPISDL